MLPQRCHRPLFCRRKRSSSFQLHFQKILSCRVLELNPLKRFLKAAIRKPPLLIGWTKALSRQSKARMIVAHALYSLRQQPLRRVGIFRIRKRYRSQSNRCLTALAPEPALEVGTVMFLIFSSQLASLTRKRYLIVVQ